MSSSDSTPVSPARAVAASVLVRVWTERAFAAAALDRALLAVDARDAGLATELVYGVLRTQAELERHLARHSKRGRAKLEPAALAHLLIAAYSIAFLDRVPTFAAISEATKALRQLGAKRESGYANAVLRSFSKEVEQREQPLDIQKARAAAAPGWLRGTLRRTLGRREAEAYLGASWSPAIDLCVRHPSERERVMGDLTKALPQQAEIELGQYSPHALVVRRGGDPKTWPGFEDDFIVQEQGAQLVTLALGAQPGQLVLDACAGRGNKCFLLSQVGDGQVDATDLYQAKLDQLGQRSWAGALRRRFVADWSTRREGDPVYDAALVDAPCSGVGTLRRRPEIALHRSAEDIGRLAQLQLQIVRSVARFVKPGGRLLFAVCSVLKEEAEEVVAELIAGGEDDVALEPAALGDLATAPWETGATEARLLPSTHGTDGYFFAALTVRAS